MQQIKPLRKFRSGDMFLKAIPSKQSTTLVNYCKKLAHLEITASPYDKLTWRVSVVGLLNVPPEETLENNRDQKECGVGEIKYVWMDTCSE
ncbi:hypothetical protein TNCT_504481 [Trichonephila clavata]|uniref:Uncharacterized protein n=1 Tax=Trichonephila clavata TaxID=2740835 RepID=A0A8X6JDZ9_TRICU|nr:hypothetical protein TNCT_504481 [Trichonephila clavata]